MKSNIAWVPVLLALVTSCGTTAGTATDVVDPGGPFDVHPDVGNVDPGVGSDAFPEATAGNDASSEVRLDVGQDVLQEAGPEIAQDEGTDAEQDPGYDVLSDAGLDAASEIVSDVSQDLPSDAPPDSAQFDDVPDVAAADLAPVEVPETVEVPDTTPIDAASEETGGCLEAYPGQVVLTEILLNPMVSAPFVEVYNAGFADLKMNGWVLSDGAGGQAALALPSGVTLAPGAFVAVALAPVPSGSSFLPDLVASGVDLGARYLEVRAGATLVDAVDFRDESTWLFPQGASLCLRPDRIASWDNDKPGAWCPAVAAFDGSDLGSPGVVNPPCPPPPACGDGNKDPGEACDDGKNGTDTDGCSDACRFVCQSANVDCPATPGDCLGSVCVEASEGFICGTALDPADVPDDGNACTTDSCDGDGPTFVAAVDGTACDIPAGGAGGAGAYCVSGTCQEAECGDGVKGPLEACDDGGREPGDGCDADCAFEAGACPADMVLVPARPEKGVLNAFCADRWEASRSDATDLSEGSDSSVATSRPGVLPWREYPMSTAKFALFQAACDAAGKRLCTEQEWYFTCAGTSDNRYVFGDTFDRETCNCVDTFCDDFCVQNGIAPENCITDPNCGYTYYCFNPSLTGAFAGCVNEFGMFDVNGNLWEIVTSIDSAEGWPFEVRGGAFNCGNAADRLDCTFSADWLTLWVGFRCCADPG